MQEENNNKTSWQEKLGKAPKNGEIAAESEGMATKAEENVPKKDLSEIEILQQKLQESEEKNIHTNEKLLRSLAELDNVRRRANEELEKASKYAITKFVGDLIVVAENFFLACDNLPQEKMDECPKTKNFVDAVMMTKRELLKILEKNQVKRAFPLDQQFDHHFHEAISHIESEKEEGIVLQVMQAGYIIGERLIRPALVVVSKGKA
ncbi:MAG TPA: nucleotide exchange factor GrpE [Rickettsiales bacterium]|nr:nucleotide exchange factor GrpE [Rickettsiales bacterium]